MTDLSFCICNRINYVILHFRVSKSINRTSMSYQGRTYQGPRVGGRPLKSEGKKNWLGLKFRIDKLIDLFVILSIKSRVKLCNYRFLK